jgi:hypothetical protein
MRKNVVKKAAGAKPATKKPRPEKPRRASHLFTTNSRKWDGASCSRPIHRNIFRSSRKRPDAADARYLGLDRNRASEPRHRGAFVRLAAARCGDVSHCPHRATGGGGKGHSQSQEPRAARGDGQRIQPAAFDQRAARAAAKLLAAHDVKGNRTGTFDLLIAAHAHSLGVPVAYRDGDFDRFGVKKELWPDS